MPHRDVLVVGAGIVGLAHAFVAARAGRTVAILERDAAASGATVRNFGMVWPIGQPAGPGRRLALRSREVWLEAAAFAGFACVPCGSLHLAHHDDEWRVLQEFVAGHPAAPGRPAATFTLLSPEEARRRCPAARPERLVGAMFSPDELGVDPREVAAALPREMARHFSVEARFNAPVASIGDGRLVTAGGEVWTAERIYVCSGDDARTLYPRQFLAAPLRRCKLQMLRTAPQPDGYRLGPHLAAGLSLRHYAAFAACPSLAQLRARIAAERPELDRWGIHALATQNAAGELVLGDSHEYAAISDAFPPGGREEIDALILGELHRLLEVPDLRPARRWQGTYLKRTDGEPCFTDVPEPGVRIVTGLGGMGMTLSFALAEQLLAQDGLAPLQPPAFAHS